MLWIISTTLNFPRLDLWPRMWYIQQKVPCAPAKSWNSLFWGEMSYRYQLGLTGLLYHLSLCFLFISMFSWSIHRCEWDIKVSHNSCLLFFPHLFFFFNFGCTRSSLLLRTSLLAASWGYSVIALHWLFNPVFLLMQIIGSMALSLSSCGPPVLLPWGIWNLPKPDLKSIS